MGSRVSRETSTSGAILLISGTSPAPQAVLSVESFRVSDSSLILRTRNPTIIVHQASNPPTKRLRRGPPPAQRRNLC